MRVVVFLGAGASMQSGLPGMAGILPRAFQKEGNTEILKELDEFLVECFHLPSIKKKRTYPALPLLLGLLDDAIGQEHHFSPKWDADRLRHVRRLVEYAIYSVVSEKSAGDKPYYRDLLEWLAPVGSDYEPTLISVNYDLLADDAFIELSRNRPDGVRFPRYGCDIATDEYLIGQKFGWLLKLGGSLHWLYCPACQRMDAAFYSKNQLSSMVSGAFDAELLSQALSPSKKGYPCRTQHCEGQMRPVLIAPTPMREYRIPQMAKVWYAAERALQQADRAIFIGYGLQWSDLQVIYMLKRGLGHLKPNKIVIVLRPPREGLRPDQFEVGQRYLDIFGPGLDWYLGTFEDWLEKVKAIPVAAYKGEAPIRSTRNV